MSPALAFALGAATSSIATLVALLVLLCKDDSPVVLVDPFWLGNEDRWSSLREIVLTERGYMPSGLDAPGAPE